MKLWLQIFLIIIIATIVHIVLSWQIIFLGSLYRFNNHETSWLWTGEVVYLQDKKVVTQKITEFTKITNLQNDITSALSDTKDAFVYLFTWENITDKDLYTLLKTSTLQGVVLTNDWIILLPHGEYISNNWYAVTNYWVVYKIKDVFPVVGKRISLARLIIEKNQKLLPKSIEVMSYHSPISLGQLFIQPKWGLHFDSFAICMISFIEKDMVSKCDQLIWELSNGFFISTYWQIAWIIQENNIDFITKEQTKNWINFINSQSSWTLILKQEYINNLTVITPLLRGIYNLSQTQGRLVNSWYILNDETVIWSGDIIKAINDTWPIYGRNLDDLIDGIGSGELIQFEK